VSLEVCIADLTASAVAVTGIGEDLASSLVRVEGSVESASDGWQGLSAAALSVVVRQWCASSASLLLRLGSHAEDLHGCAASCFEGEQSLARAFGAP
jgi:uncharacterized protein YukE